MGCSVRAYLRFRVVHSFVYVWTFRTVWQMANHSMLIYVNKRLCAKVSAANLFASRVELAILSAANTYVRIIDTCFDYFSSRIIYLNRSVACTFVHTSPYQSIHTFIHSTSPNRPSGYPPNALEFAATFLNSCLTTKLDVHIFYH